MTSKNKFELGRYSYSCNKILGDAFQRICGNRGKKYSEILNHLIIDFLLKFDSELDKDEIEEINKLKQFEKGVYYNE